ncbi:N-acetylmuramoyl-L-alanine amidase [Xanthomonas sp. AmX2]|uniref:N-acetylmuramoyl-L-alanine amidase n=1 Tax=Xanthomonas sp. TaxID=29446 RepID=UPI00198123B6|nr:N-acetylmuramoyl-L-alanine amidase [Xanthomonas sp.]MBN6148947.1 N-acetylmuramoyl-L-alanine amidase [Xanthomonas sp.]
MPHAPSPLPIRRDPLPYCERLPARAPQDIDLAVIHCTELPDLATARDYGERVLYPSGTGNSGHYYIDRDGSLHEYVPPQRVAHHVRGYNPRSIGIELVNRGRYPHWLDSRHQALTEPYPAAQIAALIALLRQLCEQLPNLRLIAGHDALDRDCEAASDDPAQQVRRKLDPGPLFPWTQVLDAVPLAPYAG